MTQTTPEQGFAQAIADRDNIIRGLLDEAEALTKERDEQRHAADHWMTEATRDHNALQKLAAAHKVERDALEEKVDKLEWENKGIAEWRGEYALMTANRDKAIEGIVALTKERDELRLQIDIQAGSIEAVQAANQRLAGERDEYAKAADDMAAAHKVERDELQEKITAMCKAIPNYDWSGDSEKAIAGLAKERDTIAAAAKLALEALESIPQADSDCDVQTQREDDAVNEAIAALRHTGVQ